MLSNSNLQVLISVIQTAPFFSNVVWVLKTCFDVIIRKWNDTIIRYVLHCMKLNIHYVSWISQCKLYSVVYTQYFFFFHKQLFFQSSPIVYIFNYIPFTYLLYLCPCQGLGHLKSWLCDLFFIFISIFIMINRIISWIQTHLFFCLFFRISPINLGW